MSTSFGDLHDPGPPLALLVLDALADGSETLETMRDDGEVPPYGLAAHDRQEVLDTIRSLLQEGSIVASEVGETDEGPRLVRVAAPASDDESLGGYWFEWTAAGERVWRDGAPLLDAYWDARAT